MVFIDLDLHVKQNAATIVISRMFCQIHLLFVQNQMKTKNQSCS